MTFEELLNQVVAMLQRRGRVSYRTLTRQFGLDDAYLEDLKEAILFAYPQAVDEADRGLVWNGEAGAALTPTPDSPQPVEQPVTPTPPRAQTRVPPSEPYTPEAERRQLTVLLTFRTDFSPPWTGRAHLTQVTLNRLPRRQAAEMTARVAHGKALPSEVVEQVVAKTDGVPLFVEELTKMVLESGLLQEHAERYELTGPLRKDCGW